jgi:hypothetical protein
MPNWFTSRVYITGSDSELARFKNAHLVPHRPPDERYEYDFDFNSVIPGSEWCCRLDVKESIEGELYLFMRTPWKPPVAELRKLIELWPLLRFEIDGWDDPVNGRPGPDGTWQCEEWEFPAFH